MKIDFSEEIRFGMGGIKGVGEAAVENIIAEREKNGWYKDIYDFIGGDKLNWIVSGSDTLPVNSLATDIFIRDDKCVVDLNPSDTEYSAIQNKAGSKEIGILIGDYKVNQPQGGRIQKQGVMKIPILDTDNEKQAF